MTKVIKISKQLLTPKSRSKNIKLDSLLKANRPGKRMTEHGTIYYEKRENRSDKSASKFPFL